MSEISVMLLGPSGVGKTTLLATMYKELGRTAYHNEQESEHIKSISNFDITAHQNTGNALDNDYEKLKTILKQPSFTPLNSPLRGTQGIIEHKFKMSFGQQKLFDLVFYDIKGGLLHADDSDSDFRTFKKKLTQSYIIINVIDGAALMNSFTKHRETLHDDVNKPTKVRDLLKPVLDSGRPCIVLFVVNKCETWFKEAQKLRDSFEERHREVINLIETRNKVAGMYIPVKTLGCVQFSRFEGEDDKEQMVFVRNYELDFKPEDVDQPLRHALSFALSHYHQNRNVLAKMFGNLSGKNTVFRKSLTAFLGKCKAYKTYRRKKDE